VTCYTVETADGAVARVHADTSPSARSREAIRDVIAAAGRTIRVLPGDPWPEAVSDGLTLACHDCGEVPRFDYRVEEEFWERWVPGPERTSVVCLPCLDRRCGGQGLGEALISVHWTGTGHTVCLVPERVVIYSKEDR